MEEVRAQMGCTSDQEVFTLNYYSVGTGLGGYRKVAEYRFRCTNSNQLSRVSQKDKEVEVE